MSKNILVVLPVNPSQKEYLEKIGVGCTFCFADQKAVTLEQVRSAQIILGNVGAELVKEAEQLEWMQLFSAGANKYCKPGIFQSDTILTNATGAFGLAISEYMLAVSLMMQKQLGTYYRNQMEHRWHREGDITFIEGSTTLVVGLGDIGGAYAKRMKALGSYTIGIRRTVCEKPSYLDEIYTIDKLDELLPRADFVAFALPETTATKGLLDERRLRLMKKEAFLVNVGRGTAIDTDALVQVLKDGWLGGCALDVTDPEPLPENHPLWDIPRVIITPHISGQIRQPGTFDKIVRLTGENLEKFLAGKTDEMKNIVDLELGYKVR